MWLYFTLFANLQSVKPIKFLPQGRHEPAYLIGVNIAAPDGLVNSNAISQQGCIQVSDIKGDFTLNISEKGGSVHWRRGIQYKCFITFSQMWAICP